MPANLVVMEMFDFDVILGVDWLKLYQVVIDHSNLVVEFNLPDEDYFVYKIEVYRPPVLPTYELWGRSSLAAMMIEDKQESSLSQIPVVCDYPKVFPEDLPGLPPKRDVKFCIDLVSGTAPILKMPYHMAP